MPGIRQTRSHLSSSGLTTKLRLPTSRSLSKRTTNKMPRCGQHCGAPKNHRLNVHICASSRRDHVGAKIIRELHNNICPMEHDHIACRDKEPPTWRLLYECLHTQQRQPYPPYIVRCISPVAICSALRKPRPGSTAIQALLSMHDTSFAMQMDASDDFGWRNIRMIAFLNPEGFESAQMLSISGAHLPVRERCCASQVPSLVSHAHVTTSSSEPHRVQKVSDVCTRSDKISL